MKIIIQPPDSAQGIQAVKLGHKVDGGPVGPAAPAVEAVPLEGHGRVLIRAVETAAGAAGAVNLQAVKLCRLSGCHKPPGL